MDQPTPWLSVIIPAYNEEKRIGRTLNAVFDYLSEQDFSWEILIVLDGSKDNTLAVVSTFAEGRDEVRWIDRKQNRGKGYTVRQGMLESFGQYRLFTDADNSTDMEHFNKMRPLLQSGHDVVIASRDGKDVAGAMQSVPQSGMKRLLGNLGNLVIQALAVPGIWDTQCGYKCFSAEAAQTIFSRATIDGWAFDIEALALARKNNYRIGIIPAHWIAEDGSHVKPFDYIHVILETVKIRWNLLHGRYS